MRQDNGNSGADTEAGAVPAPELFAVRRRPGDLFFAGVLFVLALFLLSRLPAETRWFDRVDLALQPRFWPAVVLGAFTLFSGLHLMQSWLVWNKTAPRPSTAQAGRRPRPSTALAGTPASPRSGIARRPHQRSPLARRRPDHLDTSLLPAGELLRWLRPLEFALYFVAYAASIPWLGYLLSTAVFMPLLGLRAGIRSPSGLGLLAGLGIGIVLVFKTGLEVRMPPGALYDLFPPQVRNFLIRNF